MRRDAVEDDAHLVEQRRTEGAHEASPWADADLRAVALELAFCVDLLGAAPVLETDKEHFRAVPGDVDVAGRSLKSAMRASSR